MIRMICGVRLVDRVSTDVHRDSSGLSNIFLIATAADNYIYKIGSSAIEIRFQNKRLAPILKFKEFSLCNIITTKATFSAFCCFESWFIDTEITNYVAEHHSKELTEKLLKHCEQECKSTEARAKDEFEKKVEWFKKNWMVEKTDHKPQNLQHERNNEYKMKERRNLWKKQPKRKLNEKETSSHQLKSQQDQRSTNDIESTPSDDTLVETLDAISNNNFDKDLENSVITNSSTTDQQPDDFSSENPSH